MTIQIVIDVQCQEVVRRIPHIRRPLHQVCLALLEHGGLKPYEVQQSLEGLSSFWVAVANRSRKLEDYAEVFKEG